MKKLILSLAAVSALAIGAPAAAQYSNGNMARGYGNSGAEVRIDQLQARLRADVETGAITRQEAVRLSQQLRQLERLERQYSRNGLTVRERQDLQLRIRNFRQQIRYAEGRGGGRFENQGRYGNVYDRNRDGYDDRYQDRSRSGNIYDRDRDGYDDRYERNGQYGNVYDRNRDGYDDRYQNSRSGNVYDRDGDGYDDRYENDRRYGNVYDRDGDGYDDRYENNNRRGNVYDRNNDGYDDRYQNRSSRSGGGVLGSVLGGVLGGGGGGGGIIGTVLGSVLGVGQRATGGLFAVPDQYRSQFRDGNGSYYRTDGQAIYQIDARTNTVLQVHPMAR